MREILLIRKTSEEIAIWEGHKYTKEEAKEASGVQHIEWTDNFESLFDQLMSAAEHLYLNKNEHTRASKLVETRSDRFISDCKKKYPLHHYRRSAPILSRLRSVKEKEELSQMQKACDITNQGFRRVLSFVKPGVMEYEIEAEYLHEFIRNGSRGFAYEPIVASGFNACVLHYIANDQPCQDGDCILMDIGAAYGNYNADMTRVIPVSGKFTQRQKDVYKAVQRVKSEATSLLKPGVVLNQYQKEVGKIMESELIGLGLLDKHDVEHQDPNAPLYKKYFMHGTSHFIGLDVHDVGDFYRPIEEGMVFTVEPGIYIRDESLGIGLEDDVVVTRDEPMNLMQDIPLEAEEIEDLMASR
jgi:Xaa-Pro aminopeptidase